MSTQAKLQLEDLEESAPVTMTAAELKPILEALIYVADEPIAEATLVTLLGKEHQEGIREGLRLLQEQYQSADCGLEIKEVAGGYKMATKAEHHEWVRKYVKHHTPPTKLSLASRMKFNNAIFTKRNSLIFDARQRNLFLVFLMKSASLASPSASR